MIDHALLKPDLTREALIEGLEVAKTYDVYSVCVKPVDVAYAAQYLEGTDVKVGTVIGFPHGSQHPTVKLAEIRQAALDGAVEVDVVVNIGRLKDAMKDQEARSQITAELKALVAEAETSNQEAVKIILETAYLKPEEVLLGAKLTHEAGATFVKTSTGFAGAGATLENLLIMRAGIDQPTQLKASGGVTSLAILLEMRELGVTRFGSSATAAIISELENGTEPNRYEGSY